MVIFVMKPFLGIFKCVFKDFDTVRVFFGLAILFQKFEQKIVKLILIVYIGEILAGKVVFA